MSFPRIAITGAAFAAMCSTAAGSAEGEALWQATKNPFGRQYSELDAKISAARAVGALDEEYHGTTPLLNLIANRAQNVVEKLLEAKADLFRVSDVTGTDLFQHDAEAGRFRTPFHAALVDKQNTGLAKMLVKKAKEQGARHDVVVHSEKELGVSYLAKLIQDGPTTGIDWLIEEGARTRPARDMQDVANEENKDPNQMPMQIITTSEVGNGGPTDDLLKLALVHKRPEHIVKSLIEKARLTTSAETLIDLMQTRPSYPQGRAIGVVLEQGAVRTIEKFLKSKPLRIAAAGKAHANDVPKPMVLAVLETMQKAALTSEFYKTENMKADMEEALKWCKANEATGACSQIISKMIEEALKADPVVTEVVTEAMDVDAEENVNPEDEESKDQSHLGPAQQVHQEEQID